jgi:chromate reductase
VPQTRNVAILVGSLRKGSYNKMAAKVLQDVAPSHLTFETLDIGGLPFYNQDAEENPYESWVHFREKVKASDAILFVSPEYNRSIPAVLKNAIDIGSRPPPKNVWRGKPCAVATVSIGATSAMASAFVIRQTLVAVGLACLPQPEVYLGKAADLFDENGALRKDDTREFLRKFMAAFGKWIETIHGE